MQLKEVGGKALAIDSDNVEVRPARHEQSGIGIAFDVVASGIGIIFRPSSKTTVAIGGHCLIMTMPMVLGQAATWAAAGHLDAAQRRCPEQALAHWSCAVVLFSD